MKYKNLFLIFILFTISGCSAEYNIEVNNSTIKEKLTINKVDINNFNNLNLPTDIEIDDIGYYDPKEENIDYYNVNIDKDKVDISYDYSNQKDFYNSLLFNGCYENSDYIKDDYELIINTSDEFLCYEEYDELEDLTIKITSKYKLIDTNADKIEKNNYYWYINKNNKDNKPIKLNLNTTDVNKTILELLKENGLLITVILTGIVLVVAVIIFILKLIGDRRNKI